MRAPYAYVLLVLVSMCSMLRCESCDEDELSDEDRRLRDAIRDGDEAEARRLLDEGADPSVAAGWSVSPRTLVRGEPGDWLGSYLKYHQLLWIRFYEQDHVMCPPEEAPASEPREDLARAVGEVLEEEAERVALSFDGVTALHTAAFFCRSNIAELLVEHGAAVHARDGSGLTPLHWAACAEVAEVLLDHGADASADSASGLTPLHTAIDAEVVRVLLEHGATLDARDRCGNTPLHFASSMGLSFGGDRGERALGDEPPPDAPLWARLLVRLLDDTVEVVRLLTERFDVVGAMTRGGADQGATNETGATAREVLESSRSGGDDWD